MPALTQVATLPPLLPQRAASAPSPVHVRAYRLSRERPDRCVLSVQGPVHAHDIPEGHVVTQSALVSFTFCNRPEFVTEGSTFIFREGHATGIGRGQCLLSPLFLCLSSPHRVVLRAKYLGGHR